jgi:hypothetical protein
MGAKIRSDTQLPESTTRLGDWYVNLVIIERQRLVLAASGVTLLPVVLPAAPFKTLPARTTEAVGKMLQALGIEDAKIAPEKEAMAECIVAPTNNRQVLGSMNDFRNMLGFYLEEGTLLKAALKLAESPCSPIGMDSPRRATLALFESLDRRSNSGALRLVKG